MAPDVALVRAAVADRHGNCVFHAAARNFNPAAAMSGRLTVVEAEHRQHAVVELAIRDLKDQALAHFPSGHFYANAAWTVIAALAHNLLRWISPRTIKETFVPPTDYRYPFMGSDGADRP